MNRNQIAVGFISFGVLCVLVYLIPEYRLSGFLKVVLFAYVVLLLALHPKLRLPSIDHWGDVSYGLYIYAFPVQQTIVYLMPQIRPLSMFMLSTAVTVVLAILSWKLVEKPALSLKGTLPFGRRKNDVRAN